MALEYLRSPYTNNDTTRRTNSNGPAYILDIHCGGVAANFQFRTYLALKGLFFG